MERNRRPDSWRSQTTPCRAPSNVRALLLLARAASRLHHARPPFFLPRRVSRSFLSPLRSFLSPPSLSCRMRNRLIFFTAHCSGYSQHVHGARSLTLRTRHPSPDHSLYPYPHTDHLCPIFYPCRYPTALRIDQPLASRLELAGAGCRACRAAKPRVERWRERAAVARADSPPERRVQRPHEACSGVRCVSVYESLIRMASPAGRGSLCVGSNRCIWL